MTDPTAERPSCTVRVGDTSHSIDLTPILVRLSPRQALHSLRRFADRPAGILEAAAPETLAKIAAASDWEIEPTAPAVDAFLGRIGGERAFEQWLALARWRDEVERELKIAACDAADLRLSHLETGEDDDLACDVTGRYGSLLAHRHEHAWRTSLKTGGSAEPSAPYVWAAEAAVWPPVEISQVECAMRGGAPGIVRLLKSLTSPSVEPEHDGIAWIALERDLDHMLRDGATTRVVQTHLRGWQATQTSAVCRRSQDRAYALDPDFDLPTVVDWCDRRVRNLRAELAGIGSCWRTPAGPFVAVRDRLTRAGIQLERDPVTHRVTWVEITNADPDGFFERGPFRSLELALDDLHAKAGVTADRDTDR